MKSIIIPVMVCVFIASTGFLTFAEELTAEQKEILNLEDKYWSSIVTVPNIETYKNLLHENMSAWPAFQKSPKGKIGTVNFVKYIIDNELYNSYEIAPRSVEINSNIAIVFYNLNVKGGERSDSSRVIHIWVKENGDWHMIGGMSSSYDRLPAQ